MNELHTVFDITVGSNGIGGDAWFRMAIGSYAAIVGMVWLGRAWRMQAGWRQMFNAVSLIGLGAIWLIVTLPLWNLATSDTDRLLLIQLSGQSEVTEGAVHVTHMQPLHGHAAGDKIIVGDRQFEINYFRVTPGYRKTIARGGALREGVYARLHHYDGVIIKVEVLAQCPRLHIRGLGECPWGFGCRSAGEQYGIHRSEARSGESRSLPDSRRSGMQPCIARHIRRGSPASCANAESPPLISPFLATHRRQRNLSFSHCAGSFHPWLPIAGDAGKHVSWPR